MSAKVYYPSCWSKAGWPGKEEKPPVEPPPVGAPKFFRCVRCLADYRTVRLTGRTADMGYQVDLRLDRLARQYRCGCGHVGWSQCQDLKFARGLT